MRAGECVTEADVIALRPLTSLMPSDLPRLIGSVLDRDIDAGDAFAAGDIAMACRAEAAFSRGRERAS
jgi:sialic acid synthase SpsE